MEFAVIDFETANADLASICQVGIATFRDGEPVELWSSLVNPEDEFDPVNVSVHGIRPIQVEDAPIWTDIFPEVQKRLESKIAVSHTTFDRIAIQKACKRYGHNVCECRWLDSSRVARQVWKEFSQSGYGLTNLARHFGIEYEAHDALEDARCAGLILVRAIQESKLSVEDLLALTDDGPSLTEGSGERTGRRFWPTPKIHREGNPDGQLVEEVLVFTGELSMSRDEAADMAASAGCKVEDGVTKRTTILVVGNQDIRALKGKDKSGKQVKAEAWIAKGHPIRILCEDDFVSLVQAAPAAPTLSPATAQTALVSQQ